MIIPLTSMMPMLFRAPAPGPCAKTSGRWPKTVAAIVDRRHDEEGEAGADDHSAHEHDADAVPRSRSRPVREDQRKVAEDCGRGRHENWTEPRPRGLDDRLELCHPRLAQMIRELDDEDAVLRHEPDKRDETHLAVDVQGREAQEREEEGATNREGCRARQDDERIAEALELSRVHQEDQDPREKEDPEELASLRAELTRLARVVDREPLRKNPRGLAFQIAQRLVQ